MNVLISGASGLVGGALARSRDLGRSWAMVPSPFHFNIWRMTSRAGKLLLLGAWGDVARFDYRCKP